MRKIFFSIILFLLAQTLCFGQAATYYSAGQQTNPGANTVLATTGALTSGGIIGANYMISVLLNGSVAQTYTLESLDGSNAIVNTIYLSSPANQATLIEPTATFFVPNGYTLRIRNSTAVILGGTLQASIILKTSELVDQ